MAISSYVGAEVDSASDTFQTWLTRTNELIDDMGTVVATFGIGDTNVGDLTIDGSVGANTVFALDELRGGSAGTPGDLSITSNAQFSEIVTLSSNVVIDDAGSELTINNLKTTVGSANTVFTGSVNFNQTVSGNTFVGAFHGTSNNSVLFDGQNSSYYLDWTNVTNKPDPTITLAGDLSGSVTLTNLGSGTLTASVNTSIILLDWTNVTNKPDPTITLAGDLSGSVTLTDLGSGTLTATVLDDSHNHVISNIDGLQTELDNIPRLDGDVTFTSNGHITIPAGPDADRPSGVAGMIRFNTTTNEFEGYNGTGWGEITKPDVVDDTTTNANHYPTLVTAASGETENLTVSSTKLYFNPSTGQLNATEFNSLSDETFKNSITPIQNALDLINEIDGISFVWNDTGKSSLGVSAQQLQKVLPQIVSDDEVKTVNYNGLIAVLLQAVKELQSKVDSLNK
jgi:hypothetical protein